nr:MarR family transcriptional regulator [Nocardia transvalensis]
MLRRLRATHSALEVTPSQAVALSRLLSDGPATVADLARAESVRPQSMRLTVGALEERGLVERMPHPTDQRQVLISPTSEAQRLVAAARAAKEDWLAHAMATKLSRAEQDSLLAAIPLLRRLHDD